jgi:hypothetical protein
MTDPQEDQFQLAGIPVDDVVDALRSEPALAWFLAQGLWLSQPVLEIFWPQEKVAQAAEFLESIGSPVRERESKGDDRKGDAGS